MSNYWEPQDLILNVTFWGSVPTLPTQNLRLAKAKITCPKLLSQPNSGPQIPEWPTVRRLWTWGSWFTMNPLFVGLSSLVRPRPGPSLLRRLGRALSDLAPGFSATSPRTQWGPESCPSPSTWESSLCSLSEGRQMGQVLWVQSLQTRAKHYCAILFVIII